MVLPAAVICSTSFFQPASLMERCLRSLRTSSCKTLDQSSALRYFDSNRVAMICYLGSILQKPVLPSLSLRSADYLIHTFITQFMSGPSFGPLADRFTSNLIDRLEGEDISSEWKEYPNLYTLVRDHMFHASVFAMLGEHLFRMSENFCAEF